MMMLKAKENTLEKSTHRFIGFQLAERPDGPFS